MPAADRMRLLEGLDDIGLTLKHTGEIAAWEKRMASERSRGCRTAKPTVRYDEPCC